MKNQQTNQPSYHTDDERVHGFFQDLAAALNRITGKNIQPDQNGQGLPKPVPRQGKQQIEK